jgi:hypothetical protein
MWRAQGLHAEALHALYRPSLDAVLEQLPMIVYILQQVHIRAYDYLLIACWGCHCMHVHRQHLSFPQSQTYVQSSCPHQ